MTHLPQDRTAEITFGIDVSRTGLLCRADQMCHAAFQVGTTTATLALAATLRDAHELATHTYRHIIPVPISWTAKGRR